MEKIYREFNSFADAEATDLEVYASMSPEEHLRIFLELMSPVYAATPRLQRIYRVAEYPRSPIRDDWGLGLQPVCPSSNDG